MDGAKNAQVDLAGAKTRLLAASQVLGLRRLVRRCPFKAIGGALAAGFIVGSSPGAQGKMAEIAVTAFVKQWFKHF
ncbi:MAG: hypothetical protein LBL26_10395 [Peptococcaceae bacterium]|jgi:hypothetical protein|nr:hypothetical protein [Peptococcaceae bacterium]